MTTLATIDWKGVAFTAVFIMAMIVFGLIQDEDTEVPNNTKYWICSLSVDALLLWYFWGNTAFAGLLIAFWTAFAYLILVLLRIHAELVRAREAQQR